jgi:hypothetical protein
MTRAGYSEMPSRLRHQEPQADDVEASHAESICDCFQLLIGFADTARLGRAMLRAWPCERRGRGNGKGHAYCAINAAEDPLRRIFG